MFLLFIYNSRYIGKSIILQIHPLILSSKWIQTNEVKALWLGSLESAPFVKPNLTAVWFRSRVESLVGHACSLNATLIENGNRWPLAE